MNNGISDIETTNALTPNKHNNNEKPLTKFEVNKFDFSTLSIQNDLSLFGNLSTNELKPSEALESTIGNEIQKIVIEVYNSHLDSEIGEESNFIISSYETEFDKQFRSFEELPNLLILKVLTDKIKNAIIVYKEKILDIKEISIIYKKYLNSQKTFDEICKESNVVRHYGGYDTLRLPEIDMEGRNPGNILLYMLKNVKRILIDSSDELERIFKYPLSFLIPENNTEEIEINFKSIHQEEFRKYVLKDPFINLLIEHIKSKIVDSNNKHLRETIDFIESFNVTIEKDKKFSGVLLDKINYAQIQKEIETLTETKYKQIEKDAKNRTLTKIVTKKNKEKQEMKDLDIDQLVNYISENGKTKKSKKKKSKNKKNKINNTTKEDEDIEHIKAIFKKDSCNRYLIRKITPLISQDWLNKYQ